MNQVVTPHAITAIVADNIAKLLTKNPRLWAQGFFIEESFKGSPRACLLGHITLQVRDYANQHARTYSPDWFRMRAQEARQVEQNFSAHLGKGIVPWNDSRVRKVSQVIELCHKVAQAHSAALPAGE